MPKKQSSSRMSSLAGEYADITPMELARRITKRPIKITREVRSLAASVLSQDEVKVQKRKKK